MWSYYQEYRSDMTASSVGSQLTQWTTAEATTMPPVQPIKRAPEPEPPAGDDGGDAVPQPTPTPYDDPLTLELLALLAPLASSPPGGTWHRWPPNSQRKFYNSSSTVYVTDTLMHHRSRNIHIGIATLLHSFMTRSASRLSADVLNYFSEFNVLPVLPHEDEGDGAGHGQVEDEEALDEVLDDTPHRRVAGYVRWVPTVGAIVDFLARLKAATGHPDEVDVMAFVYAHRVLRWRPDFHTFHLTRRNWRITWTSLVSLAAKVADDFPFKATLALDWRLVNDVDVGLFRRLQARSMELLDFALVVRPSVQLRYFLALLAAARRAPQPPPLPVAEPERPVSRAEFQSFEQVPSPRRQKKHDDVIDAVDAGAAAANARRAVLDTLASARSHAHRIAAAQASTRRHRRHNHRHSHRASATDDDDDEEEEDATPPSPPLSDVATDTDADAPFVPAAKTKRPRLRAAATTLEDATVVRRSRHVIS